MASQQRQSNDSPGTCSSLCGRVHVLCGNVRRFIFLAPSFSVGDFFSIKGAAVNFAGVMRNVCVDEAPQLIALHAELSNRPGLTETLVFMLIVIFHLLMLFLTSYSLTSVSA